MSTAAGVNELSITDQRPRVSLLTLFLAHVQTGFTAFGAAIIQKITTLVRTRRWLSEEEMNEGLALVQLYPGPMMVDFTAYTGYKLRGVPGALVCALGFILPSFVLMLALSAIYFSVGNLPWVKPMFTGLEAIVVGIIFQLALDFGARVLKGKVQALIALAAFVALLFKANAVLIVLASLGLGMLLLSPSTDAAQPMTPVQTQALPWRRWVAIGLAAATVIGMALAAAALPTDLGHMALSFFKIGTVAFGNGVTIMPLVQADVVDTYHWLSPAQFADGIALGQITPGPTLITATFVGYKMGGLLGATLATFAVFSPSIVMTLIFTELFTRLRNLRIIRGALAGVMASFVGLLAVMAWQLGGIALLNTAAVALAAAAFVATRFLKWELLWVFAAGLVIWAGVLALGLA
jgi:chromate transporter